MSTKEKHPLYIVREDDWQTSRDTFEGETRIKAEGIRYLPHTAGQREDGAETSDDSEGGKNYKAYKTRAVFPGLSERAIEAAIGVMYHKPPIFDLPDKLEPLREKATIAGESLDTLLRKINTEQLAPGRVGLYLDLPEIPVDDLPFICTFTAESVINWDTIDGVTPTFLVMDESTIVRDEFVWTTEERFRIIEKVPGETTYTVKFETAGDVEELPTPQIRGTSLPDIPFVFINSKDILTDPDKPPLLALNHLELAVYRGEADYRQTLFMQGQDTLVVIGGASEDSYRVGADASLKVPISGDAKFIGVDSSGLPEQRMAIENDKKEAAHFGGRLLDTTSRQKEAEGAVRIRVKASTATLNHIAITGAAGLEFILKRVAEWVGADPDQVKVTPNLDFVDDQMEGKELLDIVQAKMLGAPLSVKSMHKIMQDRGMTTMNLDDELEEISGEEFNGGREPNAGDEE